MSKHNKKRNTGLLYEFLVRKMSECIIESKGDQRDIALSIIKKHFKPNSELFKEFRLFHSLVATTVNSGSVADNIIEAAKTVAKKIDSQKLDHEKSLLIKSINYKINESSFYDQRIPDYKVYATIQMLLNEWREDSYVDIVALAKHEDILKQWLLSEKKVVSISEEELRNADPLVEKLMLKKLNEKYHGQLSQEQAELIKDFVFSGRGSDELQQKLSKLKEDTIKEIDNYLSEHSKKEPYLTQKLTKARQMILSEGVDVVDDIKMGKFLDVIKLKEEITNGGING